jgi:hypothetical protein
VFAESGAACIAAMFSTGGGLDLRVTNPTCTAARFRRRVPIDSGGPGDGIRVPTGEGKRMAVSVDPAA